MSQKFLNLVKTQICYEFLKLALSRTRPSKRENGTSDLISAHCKRRSSGSPVLFYEQWRITQITHRLFTADFK